MQPWIYESNTFLSVTRYSLKLTDILIHDHVARLTKRLQKAPGDADLSFMLGRASTALSTWRAAYAPSRAALNVYRARTRAVYDLLAEIPSRLDDWDISIQAAGSPVRPFRADKPAYLELFASGRAPFTSGALDQRIAALETLVLNLTPHAVLQDVRAEVETFTGSLLTARQSQQQEEGGTEDNSALQQTARVAVCDALVRNAGRAVDKYGASVLVGRLFDLSYVRDGAPVPPDGAPDAPSNLTVSTVAGQPDAVGGAWDAMAGITGFRVYRQLPGETGWTLVADNLTDPVFVLTGQPTGVEMSFTVTAFNEAGEGTRSVPDEITL